MRLISLILLLALSPITSLYEFHPMSDSAAILNQYETQTLERVYATDITSEIFSSVSLQQYKDFIIKLTENGSREVNSEANDYAREWIADELVELSNGRINVEMVGEYESVVGHLSGYIPNSAPCFVVGGHYDTVPRAPGANDDGTGVATMLELARVMSAYDWPLDIYFCAWNAEEIGLFGSAEVAKIFAQRGLDILLYYNIDMLLVEDPHAPSDERVLMAYESAEYWALLTRAMSNNFGNNLIHPISSSEFSGWYASDHQSFIQAGYNKVLFAFESGFSYDNAYHQPTDTYDNEMYNYTVAIETVKAIGASMAFTMVREYGQPRRVQIRRNLLVGASWQYYFPLTTETSFTVIGNWSGGGLNFSLYAPHGNKIFSENFGRSMRLTQVIMDAIASNTGMYTLVIESPEIITSDDDDDITTSQPAYEPPRYIKFNLEVVYETDVDSDGILDSEQFWFNTALFESDEDNDGLSDGHEIVLGTSLTESDTDMDGIPDGWEHENGTNPLVPDAEDDYDADGLSNVLEYAAGTLPNDNDTDNDLMPDGYEVVHGLNPLANDSAADLDFDDICNLNEYMLGIKPNDNDSDGDQMPDGWELLYDLDPLTDDANLDPDEDSFTNLDEYNLGLDPHHPDSRLNPMLFIVLPIAAIGIVIIVLVLRRRVG